jgi:hypothetical protein
MNYFFRIMMKSFLLIVIMILLTMHSSFAQPLTGIKSIPGDYATIEAAISALNLQGVGAGGVTFNVNAGHTETFTSSTAGSITAAGTSSNQILFQKSGAGNNPLITAGLGVFASSTTMTAYPGDAIISIEGGDYISFDGIDLRDNPAATGVEKTEVGYFLKKASSDDACKNVTIKNSNITLDRTTIYSWGIYISNFSGTTAVTITSTGGRHESIKVFNNSLSNVYSGIFLRGFSAASPYDFYDQNIEIGVEGANSITNYGGGSTAAYGLRAEYQNNLKIANNTFSGGGASQTTTLYGISTGSGFNSNIDIYGNTITLSSGGTSSIMYALSNTIGSTGTNNIVNINNNIIENCSQPGATGNSTWLLYNLAGGFNVNIYNNIIRNNSRANGTVYCINNSGGTNGEIYGNQIYNNSSGALIHGIYNDDGTTISVYRNLIYNISSFSSSTSLAVSGITIPGGTSVPLNVYVHNNFISDLKATASASVDAIRGINITGTTANSVRGLYYNTIFLNTLSVGANFGSTGIYHTLSSTATSSVLDMRNNIVVNNSTPNGTGRTVAFRRSSATNLNNYSTISNNNSFYSGTPGPNNLIFFDGTNSDQTIADFRTRVSPRESFSFTENVPFVNNTTAPYDLHVNTGIATQTESGGTPVTTPIAVTTDFDGNTRNASSPDVGADEFNGIGIDITAPFIGYTPLAHTTSTVNRNLTGVTIIDGSGVNTSPGTKPRIYFKRYSDNNTFVDNTSSTNGWKYIESSSAGSPFDFLINYSLLFGGTGVQGSDTVQYFVVAQDLASTPNVGITEGTFTVTPSSVNLTANAFPITGNINNYRIQFVLSGTVTVGSGGTYSTLTGPQGLFASLNENFVGGNITAQITGNISEPGTNALDQWQEVSDGNYTLTIQPDAAVLRTFSGSSSSGLIRLNGADKVIIDGRFNGSGNYLAFQNTNTASNTAAIHIISLGAGAGATDITIRNSVIKAGSNSSSNIFGIFIGGTTMTTGSAGGADNDNISILGNNISNCRVGIFARGTTSDQMNNLNISGNIIGSDNASEYVTEYGTYLGYADAPLVTNNEVYNMIYDVSKWGIYFTSNINNAVVSKNKVHSISQPGTTGFNSVGIVFFSATGCFDNQIDNNMVYNLNTYGSTSMFLVGIRIAGGANYKVYFNSVNMTGEFGNTATGIVSSCLYFSSASTNADVRNNIFSNTRTGNDPKNYAVYSPNTSTFLNINNNDYWTTGSVIGYFGADIANFNDWKTAVGQDGNSVNVNPMFTGNNDLHINSGVTPIVLESGGAAITGLNTDFDGDGRPGPAGSVNGGATAPDIGADEFDGVPGGSTTFQLTVNVDNGWNMVSIPGLHPTNQQVLTWWPGKDPGANVFKYSGGYQSITEASPTEGYWMKNAGAQTYNTGDEWPAGGINIVVHNPIAGAAGWNLIGGYEYNAQTSGITTNPPGLIEGSVFGYSGGYQAASELLPGYGYWIKLSGAGQIILPPPAFRSTSKLVSIGEEWGRIIITDNTGRNYTLYSVEDGVNLNSFELPPLPPADMFDVRYSSGRYAEDLNKSIQQIEMSGVVYPVKLRTEGIDVRLQDETGIILNERIKSGEEITIIQNINKLNVSKDIIPDKYSLEQNYPNPFNPATVIEFAIPEDSKNVTLTIYNSLGEKIAELLNRGFEAGYYKYQWNASNYASGLYIYELRTEKFISVKKMILMK